MFLLGCADKGVYVGEKKDGKRHGQGILTFSDGSKYEGEYRDDKKHGRGTETFSDGSKYEGEYRNDKKHGQGTKTFSDGNSYEGEWKDGEQDGKGEYSWSNGRKYVGEWKDGFKTGQGTLTTSFGFDFKYNVHSSLPNDWVNEFYIIMNNLDKVIPVKPTKYFSSLDIFTWNSSTDKPFKNIIGGARGASLSGGGGYKGSGLYMVLEIPANEFKYNDIHRYSVIPHEYFHAFQTSLSKNFYNGIFKIKWINEGGASAFESLYTQQYHNKNYFKSGQNRVNIAVVNKPEIFESYRRSGKEDSNYSSSVFMVLALVKELKKLDFTEEKAFKLILNDYWRKNPSNYNWKKVFQEVFNISLENFYKSLKNYTNDINSVLPSESLKLENIFSN
jgi:hypothetical protein